MFSWYVGILRRQFTSRVVFQEGNPSDWRDRLAVDDTWTVTVHVDLALKVVSRRLALRARFSLNLKFLQVRGRQRLYVALSTCQHLTQYFCETSH